MELSYSTASRHQQHKPVPQTSPPGPPAASQPARSQLPAAGVTQRERPVSLTATFGLQLLRASYHYTNRMERFHWNIFTTFLKPPSSEDFVLRSRRCLPTWPSPPWHPSVPSAAEAAAARQTPHHLDSTHCIAR